MKIEDDAKVLIAHDLEAGDFLPECNGTICNVKVRTERLGVEWADLAMVGGRILGLDGHDGLDDIRGQTRPHLTR